MQRQIILSGILVIAFGLIFSVESEFYEALRSNTEEKEVAVLDAGDEVGKQLPSELTIEETLEVKDSEPAEK